MRISFSIPLKPQSGKQKFAMRLAKAMDKKGVKITDKKPHVNLVFIKGVRRRSKNIFRLDGVWMNTSVNYGKKNKSLINTIKSCDGLVYQNKFCKKAADVFLGKFKSHTTISNGAPLAMGQVEAFKYRRPYILTFNRWRPHKRLKDTIDGFLYSGLEADYDLLVLGDKPDYKISHSAVKYMGKVSKPLNSIIVGCKYVVHLAYVDWCPNSVVESLVCGKNVMHTSTGGTKYVVRDNGIRINDKPWNFSPIRLYDPPRLDMHELREGYVKMFELPPPQAEYLDINCIADKYIHYCREILKG